MKDYDNERIKDIEERLQRLTDIVEGLVEEFKKRFT